MFWSERDDCVAFSVSVLFVVMVAGLTERLQRREIELFFLAES